jgi:phage tail sheath protein FI
MTPLGRPGVYVDEVTHSAPTVVDVPTAVPAFVGYTEKAARDLPGDLTLRATRVESLIEFEALFGQAALCTVAEVQVDMSGNFVGAEISTAYQLHHSLRLYFSNGGGACYIVSVGGYKSASTALDRDQLVAGVDALGKHDEPTLLVCPDAALLGADDLAVVQQAMLRQCSHLQDRFAVLDTRLVDPLGVSFRDKIGVDSLRYGAAYTPWLKTPQACQVGYAGLRGALKRADKAITLSDLTTDPDVLKQLVLLDQLLEVNPAADIAAQELWLEHHFAVYRTLVSGVLLGATLACPPSGAVIGVYAATDRNRGVWKAPVNVALSGVLAPAVSFNATQLDALSVDTSTGKSINAIRAFAGKGVLIWGARTLAGNDNEWRYVSTRRFFIMIEESIKKSTAWVVFEPNDVSTWDKVRGMIEAYLMQKWRDGAFQGIKPDQAFFVRCGTGQTMTAQDVLEGRLIVEIGLAVVRPAEFIILRFSCSTQSF